MSPVCPNHYLSGMEINLHNKTALVCGSSAGIGKVTAQQFASAGARVILLARNEDKLKDVLKTLDQSHGQNHDYLVADFSKPDELSDVINAFAKRTLYTSLSITLVDLPLDGLSMQR